MPLEIESVFCYTGYRKDVRAKKEVVHMGQYLAIDQKSFLCLG